MWDLPKPSVPEDLHQELQRLNILKPEDMNNTQTQMIKRNIVSNLILHRINI